MLFETLQGFFTLAKRSYQRVLSLKRISESLTNLGESEKVYIESGIVSDKSKKASEVVLS